MEQLSLKDKFNNYVAKKTFFENKELLSISFKPSNLPHRDEELDSIASILAPSLKGNKPSNLFLYGKTGTGKTASIHYITKELKSVSDENSNKVKIIYINCKMRKVADTEYRLLARLAKEFGKDVPPTGLPTDHIYQIFFESLDKENKVTILILDEIDVLVEKTGDEFLYNLLRINEDLENSKLSIVGISNDLSFTDNLDPRVRSSLSEEEILFSPYNAVQLQDILRKRMKKAFKEGSIKEGVIEKTSALAAQEHGDARRALDLIRVAAEIGERKGCNKIRKEHVNLAEKKIDMDRISEVVKTQPRQSQAVLWSILKQKENGNEIQTGDVYNFYQNICKEIGMKVLTERRVSDLISELDLFGIINSKVVSRGRYGRTRIISVPLSNQIIKKVKNILKNQYYFA